MPDSQKQDQTEVDNDTPETPKCKHCGAPMKKMTPPQLAPFGSSYFWVCFNDDCGYYERGWEWMLTNFNVRSSYRYKYDPFTGESGPLPVWSSDALKKNILDD